MFFRDAVCLSALECAEMGVEAAEALQWSEAAEWFRTAAGRAGHVDAVVMLTELAEACEKYAKGVR